MPSGAAAEPPDLGVDDVGGEPGEEDELGELWATFTRRWEQEFERFGRLQEERLQRVADQADALSNRAVQERRVSAQEKIHLRDERAQHIARLAREEDDLRQAERVFRVKEEAQTSVRAAANDALQSADDIVNEALEAAAARRAARDAQRKEERRRAQAEMDARRKRREEERSAAGAKATGSAQGARHSGGGAAGEAPGARAAPPPRPTCRPGAGAADKAGAAEPRPPATFAEFDAAWAEFERRAAAADAAGDAPLRLGDVPWPTCLPTVSGILPEDSPAERKRKLRSAVLRWHPDKWGRVLSRVHADDHQQVVERAKAVTQRLMDERKRFS